MEEGAAKVWVSWEGLDEGKTVDLAEGGDRKVWGGLGFSGWKRGRQRGEQDENGMSVQEIGKIPLTPAKLTGELS